MLHRKSFTKWNSKFRSKGPVLSVHASPQKFHKMNYKVSQQRSGLVSACFTAKVSQNELQSFATKVRSCQCMLHRKSFTKWVAMFRSKGPVLSVDASPRKFHKMTCKLSQQRSGLVAISGRFTAKVSQNELQSFAAKVRSCQCMLHRKSFTKWIAKFRSKGPVLSVHASPQTFHKMNCKVSQQRSGLVSGCFTAKVSQNEFQNFAAKVQSCQCMLRRKSFTKWITKFRSKGLVLSVHASPQKFHKMNCKVSQQRSGLVSACFTAKVSQNELQSFAAKVRSCQCMLRRKRFTKGIAKFRSKGPVLSVDASPQKFHKMTCKVSQQRSGLVSACFTAKVSQNELQSFAAKVRSCQCMLHRKSFTKWVAKFRSKGPVLSVDASPRKFHKMTCKLSQQRSGLVAISGRFTAKVSQNELQSFAAKVRSCQCMLHRKRFTKWIVKFRSKGPVLSVDASPQKFHKMNFKISQQRSSLVSACFAAKVSQNELQSFAAKVWSCQCMLHRKSFTKWIAKFRSKGPVLSVHASPQKFHKMSCKVSQQRSGLVSACFAANVSQKELQSFAAKVRSCQWTLHRKSFTKWLAKFHSKGPVLSVHASPQKFHKMNCKVSLQTSGLVSACFTAKVSQNEFQNFAAKVRSCQCMLRPKSFTKWIAKFRSKGPVLSVHASPQTFHKMNCKVSQQRSGLVSGCFTAKVSQNEFQNFAAKVQSCQCMLRRKSFTKWIAKFRSKGLVLSVHASPQKFHKMNCKVSQQRSGLVSACFTAKVSQNELQSFAAKVRSCQCMLRRKSFTKGIAKFRSKGPVLSVDASPQKFHKMTCKVSQQRSGLVSACFTAKVSQNELQSFAANFRSCQCMLHRKSFTKWIAKFHSKGLVLSVDASPQKFHKMTCKVSQQRSGLLSGCFTAKVFFFYNTVLNKDNTNLQYLSAFNTKLTIIY